MATDTTTIAMNTEILEFIATNKIATVCCTADNKPYCFNCFYSFLEEEACLVFKSAESSKHMQIIAENNQVAGTIIASAISMTKIVGIQFEGIIAGKDLLGMKVSGSYYSRYPFAVTVPGRLLVLKLEAVKYTNTTNGITHKKQWERELTF